MLKTRMAILFGSIALIVAGVVLAAAQGTPGQGPRPPRGEGMQPPPFGVPDVEHLARALSLTEAQTTELKPFLDAERATVEALMKTIGQTHQQIQAATNDGHFEEAQVRTLAGQLGQAQTDLIVEQERVKARIYSVLTPEQRAQAEQMHRHGPHPVGPGGPGRMPPPPPPQPDGAN
jgi:Spy/CpxP family protein refolding chaperone